VSQATCGRGVNGNDPLVASALGIVAKAMRRHTARMTARHLGNELQALFPIILRSAIR
jgi:hypothetical protein